MALQTKLTLPARQPLSVVAMGHDTRAHQEAAVGAGSCKFSVAFSATRSFRWATGLDIRLLLSPLCCRRGCSVVQLLHRGLSIFPLADRAAPPPVLSAKPPARLVCGATTPPYHLRRSTPPVMSPLCSPCLSIFCSDRAPKRHEQPLVIPQIDASGTQILNRW
jgi:hypothetical protein